MVVCVAFEETARDLHSIVTSRPSYVMTGMTPVFERQGLVDRFGSSENGVLIVTGVGTEGLDLQCASTLVNFDLPWNPMVLEQRIGRIDRIGQTKSAIDIYNFVVAGSIDERILKVLGEKLGLLSGSILEPSTILADANGGDLVLPESLDLEMARARELVAALRWSEAIMPDDHAVMQDILETYCDISVLRSHADEESIPWLRESEASAGWLKALGESATTFGSILNSYA